MSTSLIVLGLLLLVLGPFHVYLWKRLVKDTTRPGAGRIVGTLVLLARAAVVVIAFSRRLRDTPLGFIGVLPGCLWVALLLYLVLALLVLELPRFWLNRRVPSASSAPAAQRTLGDQRV